MKKTRKMISLLLICVISICSSFMGKGVELKATIIQYNEMTISKTINGVTWIAHGYKAWNREKKEYFIYEPTFTIQGDENVKKLVIPESIMDATGTITADITKLEKNMFKNNTKLESVTLNSKITTIEENCFSGCTNLKSVATKNKSNIINVKYAAFEKCTSLEDMDIILGNIGKMAFYGCEKIQGVEFGGTEKIAIDSGAFYETSLEEVTFSEDIPVIHLGYQCFMGTLLKDVTIPSDCYIASGAFKNCYNLCRLEFKGNVERKEINQMYSLTGAFENAFIEEYENGELIKKEVVFNKNVILQDFNQDYAIDIVYNQLLGDFKNCSGLTKVTFNGEATIPEWTFYGCMNLREAVFNAKTGMINLGSSCFYGCKLKELHFFTNIMDMNLDDVAVGNVREIRYSPFNGSNITDLYIEPTESINMWNTCYTNIACTTLKNVFLGEYVNGMRGKIFECQSLNEIVINSKKIDMQCFYDLVKQKHYIIGYSSNNLNSQNTENWVNTKSDYGIFKNIIGELTVSDLKYFGSVEKENIDFEKIDVRYSLYNDIAKSIIVKASADNTDTNGYIIETDKLPTTMTTNEKDETKEYFYTVEFAGVQAIGKIIIVPKKATDLCIVWNKNAINELVSNQPVTIQDVVSSAAVTYNDGTIEEIALDELTLNRTKVVEGENEFTISMKSASEIHESKTFSIQKNYITSIQATYQDGVYYVGDEIDSDKIKLIATYRYEDEALDKYVDVTKLSSTKLTAVGENKITVYHENIGCELVITGIEVIPVSMTAFFDSDNYTYIEGQTEINRETIKAKVKYNNGEIEEIDGKQLDKIEIVSELSTELGVKAIYKNVESAIFYIPVTSKEVTKIKVFSNIKTAIEGTTLPKEMITSIQVEYNNGVTENLTEEQIDYNKLVLKNAEIKPNIENEIVVEYLGKTDTITISGIPNKIESISATYIGNGVEVGSNVLESEIKVIANNSNGVITTIKKDYLLENDKIYNVGENNVIVHYGSLQCNVNVKGIAMSTTQPTAVATVTPAAVGTVTPSAIGTVIPSIVETVTPAAVETAIPSTVVTEIPTETSGANNEETNKNDIDFADEAIKENNKMEKDETVNADMEVEKEENTNPDTVLGATISPNVNIGIGKEPVTNSDTENVKGTSNIVIESTKQPDTFATTSEDAIQTGETSSSPIEIMMIPNEPVKKKENMVLSSVSGIKIVDNKTYAVITNKNVILTCNIEDGTNLKYQFVKKATKLKTKNWKKVKNNKITIKSTSNKHGIVYIQYTDKEGNKKNIYTTGFKIDKIKAKTNIKKNKVYEKGQKIIFKDQNGIMKAKLDGKSIKCGQKVQSSGKHTLLIEDKAGNKTKIKFRVK